MAAVATSTSSALQENVSDKEPSSTPNDHFVTNLVSPCSQCSEQGNIEISSRSITHYLQGQPVIVMTFTCQTCDYRSTQIQETKCQKQGIRYECVIKDRNDLQRRLIKSKHATVEFPELEFSIPSGTRQGVFTSVENLMKSVIEDLEESQPLRKSIDPETAVKLDDFITRIQAVRS